MFKGILGITAINLKKVGKELRVALGTQDCFGISKSRNARLFRVAVTMIQMLPDYVYQIKMTTSGERQSVCLSLGLVSTLKSVSCRLG